MNWGLSTLYLSNGSGPWRGFSTYWFMPICCLMFCVGHLYHWKCFSFLSHCVVFCFFCFLFFCARACKFCLHFCIFVCCKVPSQYWLWTAMGRTVLRTVYTDKVTLLYKDMHIEQNVHLYVCLGFYLCSLTKKLFLCNLCLQFHWFLDIWI